MKFLKKRNCKNYFLKIIFWSRVAVSKLYAAFSWSNIGILRVFKKTSDALKHKKKNLFIDKGFITFRYSQVFHSRYWGNSISKENFFFEGGGGRKSCTKGFISPKNQLLLFGFLFLLKKDFCEHFSKESDFCIRFEKQWGTSCNVLSSSRKSK